MKELDFAQDKVSSLIWKIALPSMAAEFVNLLYSMVDRIYIGHIPGNGSMALTGMGICLPLILITTAFGSLFGANGAAPLCAMALGEGNRAKSSKTMNNAFSLSLITGLLYTIFLLAFSKPILFAFGASNNTIGYAKEYMDIYALGTIPVLITLTLNPVINSLGFSITGMTTIWIGAILNIVLDPIFIFKLNMGIKGAAVATVISQSISAIYVILFLLSKRPMIKLNLSDMKLDGKISRRIVTLGFSGFTMKTTTSLIGIVLNRSALFWGGDIYVGAMAILNSIRDIFNPACYGIATGAGPVMSFNYGAGNGERVRKASKLCLYYCLLVSLITWILIELFPGFFVRLFTDDDDMIKIAVSCTSLYFSGYIFMAFQNAGQKAFTSLGHAGHATFFAIFRKVIIQIPFALILPNFMGIAGVMISEPLSNIIGGLVCYFTMRRTVGKELDKMKEATI